MVSSWKSKGPNPLEEIWPQKCLTKGTSVAKKIPRGQLFLGDYFRGIGFFFWRQGEDGDFSPVASSSQHVHVGSDVACRRLWTNACPQGSRSRHFLSKRPKNGGDLRVSPMIISWGGEHWKGYLWIPMKKNGRRKPQHRRSKPTIEKKCPFENSNS